jgi:hypothetical protein
MKLRRVTEITTQTHESVVIRQSTAVRESARPDCPKCLQCRLDSPLLTPEEASFLAALPVRTIYRALEAGQVHFIETSDGSVLVCLNSLSGIASDSPTQVFTNPQITRRITHD